VAKNMTKSKITRKLAEGMRAGDLNNLVLPMISIDEYESKISDKAVAVGFYVHDKDAANDLNRFLQKSPVAILGSEVSPAPDQHGYYIVFMELMANDEIFSNISTVLKEMEPLCEIEKWKIRVRNTDKPLPFDEDHFTMAFKKARGVHESVILSYLTPSNLHHASLHEGTLTIETIGSQNAYQVIDFGRYEDLMERHGLTDTAIGFGLRQIVHCNRISNMLGEGWNASEIRDFLLIQNIDSDQCLLLKT